MPYQKTYTDEQLLQAVKDSSFMTDAIRKLGLTNGCIQSFKKHLARLKPDTSHWVNPHTLKISNLKNIKEIPLKDILVENSSYVYSCLKEKLIKEKLFIYKCSICSINTWNNKNIVLQLDHINGIHNDNRLENLRLLCPNCHSQTDTFCGELKKQDLPKCKYCSNSVRDKRAKTCQACFLSGDFRKLNWPTDEKLIELLNLYTYKEVSQILSINETSIRNRVYGKKLSKLIKRCKK